MMTLTKDLLDQLKHASLESVAGILSARLINLPNVQEQEKFLHDYTTRRTIDRATFSLLLELTWTGNIPGKQEKSG